MWGRPGQREARGRGPQQSEVRTLTDLSELTGLSLELSHLPLSLGEAMHHPHRPFFLRGISTATCRGQTPEECQLHAGMRLRLNRGPTAPRAIIILREKNPV
ncbi:hypothetical protein SRHO_G00295370 [Serrasalmus rhombeus]